MSDIDARGTPVMVAIEAVITRADGTVEDLGTVSFWHVSPMRRLLWRLGRLIRARR